MAVLVYTCSTNLRVILEGEQSHCLNAVGCSHVLGLIYATGFHLQLNGFNLTCLGDIIGVQYSVQLFLLISALKRCVSGHIMDNFMSNPMLVQ